MSTLFRQQLFRNFLLNWTQIKKFKDIFVNFVMNKSEILQPTESISKTTSNYPEMTEIPRTERATVQPETELTSVSQENEIQPTVAEDLFFPLGTEYNPKPTVSATEVYTQIFTEYMTKDDGKDIQTTSESFIEGSPTTQE